MGATLGDTGETEVLRLLSVIAAESAGPGLALGTGDDAAVWRPPAGAEVALSQDALVEGRDFRWEWISPRQLGARALEVSLSD
ncbi:MAG: thiamine-phosphate kinase, partial [Candidatus Dormibacteraeota bacterium]|nr:thiamine-phosphate kinase [Candidatus Dormibacteraeota bacterium]